MLPVINVCTYPFSAFLYLFCHPEDTGIYIFCLWCATWQYGDQIWKTLVNLTVWTPLCFRVIPRIEMYLSTYFRCYKFVKLDEFSVKVTKVTFRISVSNTHIVSLLLRFRETHSALQLPVLLFFFIFFSWLCQCYPEFRGIWSKKLFYRPPNSQCNTWF